MSRKKPNYVLILLFVVVKRWVELGRWKSLKVSDQLPRTTYKTKITVGDTVGLAPMSKSVVALK